MELQTESIKNFLPRVSIFAQAPEVGSIRFLLVGGDRGSENLLELDILQNRKSIIYYF